MKKANLSKDWDAKLWVYSSKEPWQPVAKYHFWYSFSLL